MTAQDDFIGKRRAPHDVIDLIADGDTVVVPTGAGEPPAILEALSDRRREKHGVSVAQILPLRPFGYIDPETVENVRHTAYFLNAPTRAGAQQGWVEYYPHFFFESPAFIREGLFPCDVAVTLASPMDQHGYFSISLAPDYTMAALQKARVVILEVNPGVPFAYGDCHIHIDEVTAIVTDDRPVSTVGLPTIGPVQAAIGGYVADMIPDGATLQVGYGAIPDAVVMQLTDRRGLGIHSEMMGDGILSLVEAGVVTNRRKNIDRGHMRATFALGSQRLYDFMDHNPAVQMHPVDVVNDPCRIGMHDQMHSVNATMQVDLLGQCCSESMGATPYSGTGGQVDFTRGANRSAGGKAFIVLPATAKNDTISRIVPTLTPGAHVTTGKNDVNYVVTEYGVAQLRGRTNKQRARALIEIAHPDFRAELCEAADKMRLL